MAPGNAKAIIEARVGDQAGVRLEGGVEAGHPHLRGGGIAKDDVGEAEGGPGVHDDALRLEGKAVVGRPLGQFVGQEPPDLLASRSLVEATGGRLAQCGQRAREMSAWILTSIS